MHTNLDRVSLMILAALGLPLGCAVGPGGIDSSETSSSGDGDSGSSGDSGDSGTSTSASTGDGDTGETDTGVEPDPYLCDNPVEILQAGTDLPSGFVSCDDGFVHRVAPVECVAPQGTDTAICAEFPNACGTGADCTDGLYGSCQDDGIQGCVCNYGCSTDADCDAGSICACAGVIGQQATCIPANCVTDDNCGAGLCGLSTYQGCCGDSYQLACADPIEECHVNADCGLDLCDPSWPEGGEVMHQCSYDGEGWTCGPPGWCGCDCGRPFLVDGEARVATTIARRDWSRALTLRRVDGETRRALAEYWTEVGQFEHASVASFARFATQLLALGAPPRLLLDTQAALADEIEHARLAWGLASAYAGVPVGPGPLAVAGGLGPQDTRAIVEGLIIEACVGETLAAIEVQEAASQARDPELASTLARIATDELRHAQLGWRTLRWILDGADASLRQFAFDVLADAIAIVGRERPRSARGSNPGLDVARSSLRVHGVLDDDLRAEVRTAGLAQVVEPSARALASRYRATPSTRACCS